VAFYSQTSDRHRHFGPGNEGARKYSKMNSANAAVVDDVSKQLDWILVERPGPMLSGTAHFKCRRQVLGSYKSSRHTSLSHYKLA